jgi:glycine/D-amino acid oxidase-like deaminating enzyme
LRRAAEAAHTLGAGVRFLSGGEMRERGLPPAFGCGVLEERGGTLDPGRFAMGLRGAAIAAGVRLFEMSPLVELRDAPRASARTQRGSVTADFAVLATNAYTPATGWKRRLVVPIRVSLFETRRLNEDQLAALGWQGREGIYTSHESLESYRLTDRGTIVGGAKVVRYAWGSKLPAGYDPAAFCAIEEAFRDRFPVLGDAKVAHFWGGWIALTLDFLPVLGVTGAQRNVLYGLGYAGHGVAQATQMGAMIADRIQGREHDGEAALRRRVLSWPPEPLRWLGGNLLNGVLSAIDRRTDRQIRAASEDRGAHAPDA